jgi:hypothetical protein
MLIAHGYQGKAWMFTLAIIPLSLLCRVLFLTRQQRKAGIAVNVKEVVGACIVCFVALGVLIFEALTH